jgi:hypothetical protein
MPKQAKSIPPGMHYIHLRYTDADGALLQQSGITVAYRFDPREGAFAVAFARCHDNDNYNKKIGRAITTGRMAHGDYYTVQPVEGKKDFDVVVDFVTNKVDQHEESRPT